MSKQTIRRLSIVAMMTGVDVVLSPLFRIEGMAPMSSVMNIIAGVFLPPWAALAMAATCAFIRIFMFGIPPIALTGAIFGAYLASKGYRYFKKVWAAILGEMLGTGLIGSLMSYPIMVWYFGSSKHLGWFIYTPRFIGATVIGSFIAYFLIQKLKKYPSILKMRELF